MSLLALRDVARVHDGPVPVRALAPTTLSVERGEVVGILGRSGSGKSTLLNILGLLDRPTSGVYTVDGVDVGELGERERTDLRGSVFGFVFQDFQLLDDRDALANVELGLLYRGVSATERAERATEVLVRLGLERRLHSLPGRLSGGERQRVAIARALAQGVDVLLCDEPTGNLDPDTTEEVLGQLTRLARDGMTLVIVTHEERVASVCDRLVHLTAGWS